MPLDSSFRAYRLSTLPASINGPFARQLTGALGEMQDEELGLLETAVKCRLPKFCPDDGLDKLARVFAIERYAGESASAHRARLAAAFPTWERAGSAASIETQLEAFGFTSARCWEYYEAPLAQGGNTASFFVELGTGQGIEEQEWGSFTWGEGTTWGTTATEEQLDAIMRIVVKWKAAISLPVSVVFHFSKAKMVWGVSPWGLAWGGTSVVVWLSTLWGQSLTWGGAPWGTGRWIWERK